MVLRRFAGFCPRLRLQSTFPTPPITDPQPVTRGVVEVLPQSQTPLRVLYRCMPQLNLDLLEPGAALVGELSEGTP